MKAKLIKLYANYHSDEKKLNYLHHFSAQLSIASNAQDAREIIKKADEKMQGEETSQSTMTMTIVRPSWERVITFKNWTKGRDYSLALITCPCQGKRTDFPEKGK